jgi:Ni,Fe-hydrogenase I cytochrome b subunit
MLCRTGFYIGYELAKERSYSEEEVLVMLSEVRKGSMVTSSTNNRTYWDFDIKSEKKWFEKFKKK